MIQSIKIENYRGIRVGELTALTRLSVLTGPNGCGKSTVLEALEIGGNASDVAGTIVGRRPDVVNGTRWLTNGGQYGTARIRATFLGGGFVSKQVLTNSGGCNEGIDERGGALPLGASFIEQRIGRTRTTLHKLFTEARLRKGIDTARDLLREVDPTIRGLEILTEGDTPVLHLSYEDRTVPVSLAGDGMESLVRLALELAKRSQGTFLIEEPEVHQHTAAIVRSARIITAAAKLGCQIILSTHSMELLDAMLASLTDDELDLLAVYRLRLLQGELKVLRMPGKDVNVARAGIEDDLR